jgi:hypothetical protein
VKIDALQFHLMAASELTSVLEASGYRSTLIGGLAICLGTAPRYTEDVDAMIAFDLADLDSLVARLRSSGFDLLFRGAGEVAMRARILPLRHATSQMKVDISLGATPFEEEVIDRSVRRSALGVTVCLPSPEDLFIMKVLANRPKDQQDLVSLVEVHPQMDLKRILRYLEEFSSLDGMPDLCAIAAPFLAKRG